MVDIRSAIPTHPLVRRIPEAQYTSIQKAEQDRVEAEKEQFKEPLLSLASYINKAWGAAKMAKNEIQDVLIQCARQRNGEYDPDVLADLKREGDNDPIYMLLTNIKCRAVEAWIKGVELPPGERPWSITHTPVPDIPPEAKAEITKQVEIELTQYMAQNGFESLTPQMVSGRLKEIEKQVVRRINEAAKDDAEKLQVHIDDQLTEGEYYQAINDFISDLATYPATFSKGPIVRNKPTLVWTKDQNGQSAPAVEQKFIRSYYAPSPYDMYPGPGAKNIQDSYLCERIKLRRSDLEECIGVPGFSESAINAVLQLYGTGGLHEWLSVDQERAEVEGRDHEWDDPDPPIDCVEFWGSVQGKTLLEWGMNKEQVPNANKNYNICAWMVGQWIVMARLNPHPLGRRPYFSTAFEKIRNSIWGKSPPMLMRDCQRICNAVARAMVRNLGMASGPQVEVSADRMMPGSDITSQYPWKIWPTKDPHGGGTAAVRFYQADPLTDVLMRVFEYFFKQSSEQTGIPQYIYGAENAQMGSGAGGTASGLSMLMNAATKTLQGVISNVDKDVIAPSIREHWLHVMLFDEDVMKSGDINIVARASESLIIAEQLQLRLTEMLNATNNPDDRAIMGLEGRGFMLREAMKKLKLPTGEIIPEKAVLQQRQIAMIQMEQAKSANINPSGGVPGEMTRVNQ